MSQFPNITSKHVAMFQKYNLAHATVTHSMWRCMCAVTIHKIFAITWRLASEYRIIFLRALLFSSTFICSTTERCLLCLKNCIWGTRTDRKKHVQWFPPTTVKECMNGVDGWIWRRFFAKVSDVHLLFGFCFTIFSKLYCTVHSVHDSTIPRQASDILATWNTVYEFL